MAPAQAQKLGHNLPYKGGKRGERGEKGEEEGTGNWKFHRKFHKFLILTLEE